jgi:hypothetical protein
MSKADRLEGVQIHFLVFDTFPKPLDKQIIALTSFLVHADLDAVVL